MGLGCTIENQNRISSFSALYRHVTSLLAAEALALREEIFKSGNLGLPIPDANLTWRN